MIDSILMDYEETLDIIWSLTLEKNVWTGHGVKYYRQSEAYFYWLSRIYDTQLHEYFAGLNTAYWMDNGVLKLYLPETYQNMASYFESIGIQFIE